MPPPLDQATQGTPLAPSVEKAYYRKCIELKRRLNEVEAANDEAKIRRVRLDRAIMKMRLERAFLLEQLSKRMESNVDGSEGSGDEGQATPPPERPHRDKRERTRRQRTHDEDDHGRPAVPLLPALAPAHGHHATASSDARQRGPSDPQYVPIEPAQNTPYESVYQSPSAWTQLATPQHAPQQQAPQHPAIVYAALPQQSPYGAPVGMPGATAAHVNGHGHGILADESTSMNRAEHVAGQPLSAGPAIAMEHNGQRRIVADDRTGIGGDQSGTGHPVGGGGGFTAVNQ
ncbi:hypothetical protein LTR62_007815 [Meristemomyces frigidus]|uniref:INO80 complex subunit F domain-containing protein n=1 Tax=Meristemomyces frigidus TaxID=1508187 RepID=A0AAN7TIH7_9PEZI|nr:hypothetical protein LTR62_007815 [Meristemomyces frigidus]